MIRDLIYTLTIFSSQFFFSISAILGIRTGESGTAGPVYIRYCIIAFVIAMLNFITDYSNMRKTNIKMFVPLLVILVYILSGIISDMTTNTIFLTLGAFSLPTTLAAISFSSKGSIEGMIKWLDVLLLIFSASLPFMVGSLYATILTGTTGYSQSLSYMSANVFLLAIFLLVYGDNCQRFKFARTKTYKLLLLTIMVVSLFVNLFSGGRGAFMAVLVGGLFVMVNRAKGKTILYVLSFGLIVYVGLSILLSNAESGMLDTFSNNSARVLEYVSDEGIDMSATSGRDEVYDGAIKIFLESPIIGYGLFGYLKEYMHPHNLFLEVLLQGGLLFFIPFIIVLFHFFKKLRKIIKFDKVNMLLMPIVIFSFTELMFSGSYMGVPFFWFSLTYVYLYTIKNNKRKMLKYQIQKR